MPSTETPSPRLPAMRTSRARSPEPAKGRHAASCPRRAFAGCAERFRQSIPKLRRTGQAHTKEAIRRRRLETARASTEACAAHHFALRGIAFYRDRKDVGPNECEELSPRVSSVQELAVLLE